MKVQWIKRLFAVAWAGFALVAVRPDARAAEQKVLRYAFEIAETSFDPAKISDLYSRTITPHIYEGLYAYDHLARPVKLKPLTAAAMPEVSADFKVWTIKLRPGIYFAADPAFKGQRRELVAEDYIYSFKRIADPANASPGWSSLSELTIAGMARERQEALDQKRPYDYNRPIEGLRALDRYTLQITLTETRPRLLYSLAASDILGAVAREVVSFYGDKFDAHPVGTGPFMLKEWRRSSFIALERNPDFREMLYDAQPAADDVEGQAIAARLKGRRLPMVDRVEISIIEEDQPRWLSFVNGESDLAYRVGYQFATLAMPGGKVAPNLAKKGVVGHLIEDPAANFLFFNMTDPIVGGYTPEKVALRRAIALGMDIPEEIAYVYSGLATVSHTPLMPFTSGFNAKLRSELGSYQPERAKGLLDSYGYLDRDADGWRDLPDGSPLVLRMASVSDQRTRKINEVFQKNMKALQLRVKYETAQWPENLKSARAGKLAMWTLGLYAASPDGGETFNRYATSGIGATNFARFSLPAMDDLVARLRSLPDGPDREAIFAQAEKLAIAYMPYKIKLNRQSVDMTQPQLIGYRRPVFWTDWWQYVDIDSSRIAR